MDFIVLILVFVMMFVPTIIAFHRQLKRRWACLVINLFFGWTIIFWIPILIWSMLSSATEV